MLAKWLLKGGGGGGGGGGAAAASSGAVILPGSVAERNALLARVGNARQQLTQLLDLRPRAAGRPTASRLGLEAQLEPLVTAYANSGVDDFSDWWPDGAKEAYEQHGWPIHAHMQTGGEEIDVGAASGGGGGGASMCSLRARLCSPFTARAATCGIRTAHTSPSVVALT